MSAQCRRRAGSVALRWECVGVAPGARRANRSGTELALGRGALSPNPVAPLVCSAPKPLEAGLAAETLPSHGKYPFSLPPPRPLPLCEGERLCQICWLCLGWILRVPSRFRGLVGGG